MVKTMTARERLWGNYEEWAGVRGELIAALLRQWLPLPGAALLDAGCGQGGASWALARAGAHVTAVDLHPEPPARIAGLAVRYYAADLAVWQGNAPLDGALLWDVLEHLSDPYRALQQISCALRPGGLLLIATPNRWSPFNALCDPHYGLPLLSILPRRAVRHIISGWLHWLPADKPDYPQLLSCTEIDHLLHRSGFSWRFVNRELLAAAMRSPRGLWNRPWHLHMVQHLQAHGWDQSIGRHIDNQPTRRNRWLMPTFFILARKEAA